MVRSKKKTGTGDEKGDSSEDGSKADEEEEAAHVDFEGEVEMFLRSNGLANVAELRDLAPQEVEAAIQCSGLKLGARRYLRTVLGVRHAAPRKLRATPPPTFDIAADDEGVEESDDDDAKKKLRKAQAEVAQLKNRLRACAANPLTTFLACLDRYEIRQDWPHTAANKDQRTAAQYLAQVFNTGHRAVVYSRAWRQQHGLSDCRAAEAHELAAAVIDDLMLCDGVNVVNSVAAEVLARRMYSLERVFEKCSSKGEWKSKARWKLFPTIDLVADAGTRVSAADLGSKKILEAESLQAKWLAKAPAGEE